MKMNLFWHRRKMQFCNNCPISRALIGSFLSSILRVQTDKTWKLGLELRKWATWTRHVCLSRTLFIPVIWPVSGLVIVKNKLTYFYAFVLLLKISMAIGLLRNHSPVALGSTATLTMLWRPQSFREAKHTNMTKSWSGNAVVVILYEIWRRIKGLLIKLVRSRWLDIGLVLCFAILWTKMEPRFINTQ